ncbi:MAG: 5' nucleotidase, NT5C type [Acidimicrobiia bacterium]
MGFRLGIDLDGVVADFNTGWMTRYNEEFGTSLTPDMVTSWDAMLELAHFNDMDAFWAWAHNGSGPGLFRHLPVYDGAKEALNRLSQNHEIVIITTKPKWARSETFTWIGEHEIPTREVHITRRKWRVDCDIYLDDGPHNVEALLRERPDRTTCRFVRPWNEPIPGAVDVDSWDTFVALVDKRYC